MTTFTSDYTITTLSGNLNQYNAAPSPIIPSGRIRQFSPACPYTVVNGDSPTFPFGCTTSPVLACGCLKTKTLSGSSEDGSTNHLDLGTSLDIGNTIGESPNGWTFAFWVYPTYALSYSTLYERGQFTTTANHDSSQRMEFYTTNADKPIWYQRIAGGNSIGVSTGSYDDWNLIVFQASASAGTLTSRATVVYKDADGEMAYSFVYDGTGLGIGSDDPAGDTSYMGARVYSTGLSPTLGGIYKAKVGDTAIWSNTLSLEEITGTLWNNGRPLCLNTSDLSTDLDHWWRMGDGTGDIAGIGGTVADQAGSVNGTIVGGALDIVGLVSGSDSIYCDYS